MLTCVSARLGNAPAQMWEGVSPVPAQMSEGVSPVPAQTWQQQRLATQGLAFARGGCGFSCLEWWPAQVLYEMWVPADRRQMHAQIAQSIEGRSASAPAGTPLPRLHRDWARRRYTGAGARRCPHLHRDYARRCHICSGTGARRCPHLHSDRAQVRLRRTAVGLLG